MALVRDIKDHSFLAEELLIPFLNKNSGNRINMFDSHSGQLMVPLFGETPNVFTRFENQIGTYSSGYKSVNSDKKLLKIFEFNDNRKLLLLLDKKTKELDIVEFNRYVNLTEYFGYENFINDEIEESCKIEKDDWIYRNGMYDEQLNFQYGLNYRAVFMPFKGLTFEDAIVITKSAAQRGSHTQVEVFDIMLNANDVLMAVHNGKQLLNVGDTIENGILAVQRRLDKSSVLSTFKDNNLTRILPSDQKYITNGEIADIEVFSNLTEEHRTPYNSIFFDMIDEQKKVYKTILEFCKAYKDQNYKFTENFNYWYHKADKYINVGSYIYDKREFEGVMVRIKVKQNKELQVGDKISGRFGSKGVISAIIDDGEAPFGADVILNPMGVLGRMNLGQNFEHLSNFAAEQIVCRYNDNKDFDEFAENLMTMYRILSPDMYSFLSDVLDNDESYFIQFLEECLTNSIPIHIPPFFGNPSVEDFEELLFNELPFIKKLKSKDIEDEFIVANIYYIILKHLPKGKFSVRSAETSSLLDIPYKSNEAYKKGKDVFNRNPIRKCA